MSCPSDALIGAFVAESAVFLCSGKLNGKPSVVPAKALNETVSDWLQLRSTSDADFRRRAKSRSQSRA